MAKINGRQFKLPDLFVTGCVAALTVIGLIMAFSTSKLVSGDDGMKMVASHFLKQFLFAGIGVGAFWYASIAPMDKMRKLSIPILAFVTVLLALVVWSPLGVTANGAMRWLKIGPLRFQPSEMAKLALVLFLADSMARRGSEKMKDLKWGFMPNLVIPAIPIGLIALEKDLGTCVVMVAVICAMMFIAGAKLSHLGALALAAVAGIIGLIIIEPYRMARITAFLEPEKHMLDTAFQLTQSQLAFASGGLFGAGIGSGQQKLFYLPEAHTDFVLSVWGEEVGLFGTLAVIFLFAVLTTRGIAIAIRQKEPFRRYMAIGLTSWLAFQAIINSFVVLGAAPTKGLALPFVSYGGTGLIITLAGAGLLAGLSRPQEEA